MRGNGLSCRSSESIRIVRSRWYIAAFEIIRYIRAQTTCRRVQIRHPVVRIPIGIVVRII